jgi:riboflavin kinase/FMN adenylyltransferase
VELIRDLDHFPARLRRGAISVGNFDGVHRGHALIVQRLVARARQVGGAAVIFTFDPHPAAILRPDRAPPPLLWTERKAEILGRLGADAMIAYPTDEAFLKLPPREFFEEIVRGRLGARAMVEGANFTFGRERGGTVELLRRFCEQAGVLLDVVEPLIVHGQVVSSSRIRALVAEGRVEEAARLLTQPHCIRGAVVHGAGRGRQLGFPTANIDGVDTLLPAEGIYAGRASVDGASWPAAVSLGPNPTFDEGRLKIEAYLLDFEGDLYGRHVQLEFLARLRDVARFRSVDELLAQMNRDVAAARAVVQGASGAGPGSSGANRSC